MNKLYFLLFFVVGVSACTGDFFSTTIDIDPPTPELRIATSANVSSLDSLVLIYIDRSTDIFSNISYDDRGLENADAQLIVDGNLIGTFIEYDPFSNTGSNYALSLDQPLGSLGSNYELRIDHPDYPMTSAKQTMPATIVPSNTTFVPNAGSDYYGYPTEGIRFTIKDTPNETNYYEVAVFVKDSFDFGYGPEVYVNRLYCSSFDPNTTESGNGRLFVSDIGFDGEAYELLVQFDESSEESNTLVLMFSTITEDRFLYGSSLRRYEAVDGVPFSEPVSIYSNFENGFGAFGLANTQLYEIQK